MKDIKIILKNNIVILISALMTLFLLVVGITYAYFTITVEEIGLSSVLTSTDALKVVYTDSGEINIQSGTDTLNKKVITVKNEGSAAVSYKLIYQELLNEITGPNPEDQSDLKVSAICVSDFGTCKGINEISVPIFLTTKYNLIIKDSININPNETQTYTFTFKHVDSNSLYNQGKKFKTKINIQEAN